MGKIWDFADKDIKDYLRGKKGKVHRQLKYRIQEDFNEEAIKKIADETGHPNLAQGCYFNIDVSPNSVDMDIFYDPFGVAIQTSNSEWHIGIGSGWHTSKTTHNMASEQYNEAKIRGDIIPVNMGGVDPNWVFENFWEGYEWYTNGWPRVPGYLEVGRRETKGAYDVAMEYIENYYKTIDLYIQQILYR